MIAALLASGALTSTEGNGSQEAIRLTMREDLTVRTESHWPVFMEFVSENDPIELTIDGADLEEVEVRTFPMDSTSVRVELNAKEGSLTGTITDGRSGLLMVTFSEAGEYTVAAETPDGEGTTVDLAISEGSDLFSEPTLDEWIEGWRDSAHVGDELGFALTAPIDRWNGADWGTYYNWTISVICPTGMRVGGNLSVYNTGDTRVDRSALDSTSVVSAWQNGFNNVFYTIWQGDGTMLSGTAAMTPNGKELTMGAGAFDDWIKGRWVPYGAGTLKFNDAGHYLVIVHLSNADGPVSRPLVLETLITSNA